LYERLKRGSIAGILKRPIAYPALRRRAHGKPDPFAKENSFRDATE